MYEVHKDFLKLDLIIIYCSNRLETLLAMCEILDFQFKFPFRLLLRKMFLSRDQNFGHLLKAQY